MSKKQGSFMDSIRNLKNLILGKDNSKKNQMDDVDDILNTLSSKILDKNSINYSETIKDIIAKSLVKGSDDYLKEIGTNILADAETRDRLQRYVNAEEIIDYIPYCATAVQVITDEIVSPDDITKESIQILENTREIKDEAMKIAIAHIKTINDSLGIDNKIPDIIYNTLKYGDQFIEIANSESSDVPISQVLTELENPDKIKETEKFNIVITENRINDKGNSIKIDNKIQVSIDIVSNNTSILESMNLTEREKRKEERKRENGEDIVSIDNVKLIQHDPAFVVKLQTKRFKLPLGYLVLPKPSGTPENRVSSPYSTTPGTNSGGSMSLWNSGIGRMQFTGIDKIYLDMIRRIEKYVGKSDIDIDKKEIFDMLKRALSEIRDVESGKLTIRYVPCDRMEHFVIKDQRFFPYGEGIFFKSTFAAKLLILQQVATSIKRMTESTERRVIYVEAGLPRTARNTIEQLNSALKRRKFSMDTFGSIGAIPSMVTSYEDIIIPQSKGKRFVEFDSIPPTQSSRDASEELKFFRDQIIGTLRVPPSYLGMEENTPSKANLAQESVIFARSIVAYQKQFTVCVKNLFKKIYKITKKANMPDVNMTFPPPKLLQTEIMAEHVETVRRIVDGLDDMGVSKEYSKRKYLNIDWDDVDEHSSLDDIEKKIKNKPVPDANMNAGYGGNVPPVSSRF